MDAMDGNWSGLEQRFEVNEQVVLGESFLLGVVFWGNGE